MGISSAVTATGPRGQDVSKLLPRTHWLFGELDVAGGDAVRDRVAEDVVEGVALGNAPDAPADDRGASSTSQSMRAGSAWSSSIGSAWADHARRELREHQGPLRALEVRLADVIEVVEADRDDLPGRRGAARTPSIGSPGGSCRGSTPACSSAVRSPSPPSRR